MSGDVTSMVLADMQKKPEKRGIIRDKMKQNLMLIAMFVEHLKAGQAMPAAASRQTQANRR
jgi:hypothetical protein